MKLIEDFLAQLGVRIPLNKKLLKKKENKFFLINERLNKLIAGNFWYAGIYLGEVKNNKFFPSFCLLRMIAQKAINKVVVDDKSAWLFICGRDIFKRGIIEAKSSIRRGSYTLILNRHGECLGLGKIVCDLDKEAEGVAVANVLDIGDFLRREKQFSA